MFMELGKEVVRKIRSDLSKQTREPSDDDAVKLTDAGKGSGSAESSGCC